MYGISIQKKTNSLVFSDKRQRTVATLKWLLGGMRKHMHLQRPLFGIFFLANFAAIFHTQMCVHVTIQMTLLFVPIRASIAHIWLIEQEFYI